MKVVPELPATRGSNSLIESLGLRDVVLMTVVAVVSLRWIPWGARAGPSSVTLWLLACGTFFLPLATALIALSRRYPEQGGLYVWTRSAFGSRHGFICGWCLWVNNLFYFPSLLLFGAANALALGGPAWQALADSHAYAIATVLAGIWLTVGINILGLRTGRWVQNVGTIGVWVTAALLIASGAIAIATVGSATSFAASALVPHATGMESFSTIALWSAMCFAFSGFEITSYVSREVHEPVRTIPRGILLAGAAIAIIYIVGSLSLLVALPAGALDERTGIPDAVDMVALRLHLPSLGSVAGGLLAMAAFAGTFSWMAGAARVPFAAGVHRAMPAFLGRLHPRYRTPHLALLLQGALSSGIFLASVFLTVTGTRSSIRDAYDVLVNLTILVYFIPYLYLFLSVPRLVTAGVGMRTAMAVGIAATLGSIALLFVPPPGTASVLNFEVNILVQSAAVLASGLLFYRRSEAQGQGRRRSVRAGGATSGSSRGADSGPS